jgi:hypothetical protein
MPLFLSSSIHPRLSYNAALPFKRSQIAQEPSDTAHVASVTESSVRVCEAPGVAMTNPAEVEKDADVKRWVFLSPVC